MRIGLMCVLLAGLVSGAWAQDAKPAAAEALPVDPAALARWRELRFGMFIHWGPVSLKGTEIGWSRGAQIPLEEYDQLYTKFNPDKFNADEWVKTAKDAGMRYMVITTKHHDGFCMWPTKYTEHCLGSSPFKRDVLKELSEACKRQGLRFGTYYSICDWYHPDFPLGSPGGSTRKPNPNLERYTEYVKNEVSELVRNYGPLSTIWFDVPQEFDRARGQGVINLVRSLQPDIVVNNRSGAPGDYDTPEQQVGGFNRERPWETCMTICNQWAWKPGDAMKSLQQCLRTLLMTVGGDGNLLFNVGPMPDGLIEPRQVERLREMGAWLQKYGAGVYGTRGGPFRPGKWGVATCKENSIYVYVMAWPAEGPLVLPSIGRKVLQARAATGGDAQFAQTDAGLTLSVPAAARDPIATLVELTVDGPAFDIAPAAVGGFGGSLASKKKAAASNVFQNQVAAYGPDKALDDDADSRWATDAGTHAAWLQVDLGQPTRIGRVAIDEREWDRVKKFRLEYQDGAAWKTIFAGTTIGGDFAKTFDPVTAQVVRLNIEEATEGPTIWEFALFAK